MAGQDIALPPDLLTGSIVFGPFVLDLTNRTLSKGGLPVRVRERELSILIYLAERAGSFVSRDELIAAIWSGAPVDDANVRVQMAALRRLLGDGGNRQDFVGFTPGRGYRFEAGEPEPQPCLAPPPEHTTGEAVAPSRHNLPIRIKPFFGRDEALRRLTDHLPLHRLVTIVGPGGIGKTTLALAGAEAVVQSYENGIRLVDLAGLSDARLITAGMAMTLGISLMSPDPVDDLVKFLRDKQMLIVLDNCEHLVEAAASLVETILTRTREVQFLATSREPLRADSEWLFRLGPLEVPPGHKDLNACESLHYPAVRLFVERARLSQSQFELIDNDVVAVSDLCRRLDGIPLAVELAAARVGLFGVRGLADQLADSFGTLTQGRRTALPRHQTLRATLDWSYDILPEREQQLLARLAIFRGEFTLASAQAVSGLSSDDCVDGLAELTAKSLVNVDTLRHPAQYRMLFLTRDYALEKLMSSDEHDHVARRHAETYLRLLQAAGNELSVPVANSWVDDIRSALNWTLSETGDFEIGMQLVTASFGTALRIASFHERGLLLDQIVARMRALGKPYPAFELRLLVERISILQFDEDKEGAAQPVAAEAIVLAEDIRREDGDLTPLTEILVTRISIYFSEANVSEMRRHIRMVRALSLPDKISGPVNIILERMEFQTEHFAGHQDQSLSLIKKLLAYPPEILRVRHFTIADYVNPAVTGRIFLSRVQWLQGFAEEASRTALDAIEMSRHLDTFVQCYVLAFSAIPIALWRGNRAQAETLTHQMKAIAGASSFAYWHTWGPFYEAVIAAPDAKALESTFAAMAVNSMEVDHIPTFTAYLPAAAVERVEAGFAGWNRPEIYRLQGARLQAASDMTGAQTLFTRALDLARAQSALAWELRAATSLADLWRTQDRHEDAHRLLSDVLDRFTEGLEDTDALTARRLLTRLTPP